jgi:hypothetical protein
VEAGFVDSVAVDQVRVAEVQAGPVDWVPSPLLDREAVLSQ